MIGVPLAGVVGAAASDPYGPEVVADSGFDSPPIGTSWPQRSTGAGSASIAGSTLSASGTDGSNRGWTSQALALSSGAAYVIDVDVQSYAGQVYLLWGTSSGSGYALIAGTGATQYSVTAPGATVYVGVQTDSAGGSITCRSISVRKVL